MDAGKRTVISIFEYKAVHEPESVFALQPKDNDSLRAGFDAITYKACMLAVDHAVHWLSHALPDAKEPFGALAYQGQSDLRVLLLCLAAAKLDKVVLLPSRRSSPNAQRHLVQTAKCGAFIYANGTIPMFDPKEAGAVAILAPELLEWLFVAHHAPPSPISRPWSDAQDDPWILLHTSGTTGLPKIVRYTHKMMAKFDAPQPRNEGRTPADYFSQGRWFTSIPLTHFVGLVIAFQYAAILGSICIAPPVVKGPPILSAQQLIDLIDAAQPAGVVLPPTDINKLAAIDEGWAALRKVKYINFVGAQLSKSVGDGLMRNGNIIIYGLGTTEAGGYPQLLREDREWDWFTLPEAAGATFERYPSEDNLYELIFYKNPELERMQQVFLAFPDISVFPTKDLYYKHPTLKNTWKIAGRTDDFFKLDSGYGIFATTVEETILERARNLVSAVLMAGAGREQPCLLVAPVAGVHTEKLIDELWPVVENVNRSSHEIGHIAKDMILVIDPSRPFKLNGKGAVSRRDTLEEYDADIDRLYNR